MSTAQLALNGRYYAGLGISPFFATYGYEAPSPVLLEPEPVENRGLASTKKASLFVEKIKLISNLY